MSDTSTPTVDWMAVLAKIGALENDVSANKAALEQLLAIARSNAGLADKVEHMTADLMAHQAAIEQIGADLANVAGSLPATVKRIVDWINKNSGEYVGPAVAPAPIDPGQAKPQTRAGFFGGQDPLGAI
jgi:hypothetical protein